MNYLNLDISKHLDITNNEYGIKIVTYKGFPLWKTAVGLDKLDIKIYTPAGREFFDPDFYMLVLQDFLGDRYCYGRFYDIGDLRDFLDNPFEYHQRQQEQMN